MTLSEKQQKFARMLGMLLHHISTLNGYEVTLGRGHVEGAVVKSGAPSCHAMKLACDLNLFVGGLYMTTTDSHKPLGKFWKSMGGSWGGDFDDGNHYSLKHNGVR